MKPVVAVVPLFGSIYSGPNGLNIHGVAPLIDRAIAAKPSLLVLLINSPGGSPVQSQLITQYILHRCSTNDVALAAFCEDIAASGGYWLALSASPNIFVTPTTVVGSVGVVGGGFGFTGIMEKLGIDRRLYTVGRNKVTSDPYSPETPEGIEKIKKIQQSIYDQFVAFVKRNRVVRDEKGNDTGETLLKADDDTLFNGDVWVGQEAVDLGLVDGVYYEMQDAVRHLFFDGKPVRFKWIVEHVPWYRRLGLPVAGDIAASFVSKMQDMFIRSSYGVW